MRNMSRKAILWCEVLQAAYPLMPEMEFKGIVLGHQRPLLLDEARKFESHWKKVFPKLREVLLHTVTSEIMLNRLGGIPAEPGTSEIELLAFMRGLLNSFLRFPKAEGDEFLISVFIELLPGCSLRIRKTGTGIEIFTVYFLAALKRLDYIQAVVDYIMSIEGKIKDFSSKWQRI